MSPTPVIVLGKKPTIATRVREGLLPEYDAIQVIHTVEQGVAELPILLSNPAKMSRITSNNIGSQHYDKRPLAIAAGGGFDDEKFQRVKDACKGMDDAIAWVRADLSKYDTMPDPINEEAEFSEETARRVKSKLQELGVDVASPKSFEGVYTYT